ncbi:reverse transcriptase domain-containing protein [Trichonephila clavipes]|nr:reverse transcriptase domain-containing protein [Trichonephila clavipes]
MEGEQVYPTQWQEAIVIPILRPEKILRTLLSYRPIALTAAFVRHWNASLYVDDLQISCEGSDMHMIERQLQPAVNNILKWCDTNGHSISASRIAACTLPQTGYSSRPEIRIRDIYKFP